MRSAAWSAVRTLGKAMADEAPFCSKPGNDGRNASGRRRFQCCKGDGHRTHAVLAGRGGRALAADRGVKGPQGSGIKILMVEWQALLASGSAQQELADRALCHAVRGDQCPLTAVDLETGCCKFRGEGVVELSDQARTQTDGAHHAILYA